VPVTHNGFEIIPEATETPNGWWELRGTIIPAGAGFGKNVFQSQNLYRSKEEAERHFIEFAKRFSEGKAKRADIDQKL
jgi:hypothetical protein